jgi:CheY-like chemotaxis protein
LLLVNRRFGILDTRAIQARGIYAASMFVCKNLQTIPHPGATVAEGRERRAPRCVVRCVHEIGWLTLPLGLFVVSGSRNQRQTMFKILYIEDTENNRILVSRYLERNGYQVLTAEHADDGLAMAEREQPDLILMDMALPGLDGWDATRRLKSDPRVRHIPVIALTAHVMQGDREKALTAGCDDYDTKPFQFPRLLAKIEALLASAKPRSPQ